MKSISQSPITVPSRSVCSSSMHRWEFILTFNSSHPDVHYAGADMIRALKRASLLYFHSDAGGFIAMSWDRAGLVAPLVAPCALTTRLLCSTWPRNCLAQMRHPIRLLLDLAGLHVQSRLCRLGPVRVSSGCNFWRLCAKMSPLTVRADLVDRWQIIGLAFRATSGIPPASSDDSLAPTTSHGMDQIRGQWHELQCGQWCIWP